MVANEKDFLNFWKSKKFNMPTVGKYDLPLVKGIRLKNPSKTDFIGFNYATNPKTLNKEKLWVHFFLPDCRFSQVWNNPQNYIETFRQYKGILSPDFSLYFGMPKAMQIFQVYRNAFLSAYYEHCGIHVLPSVTWGEPDTYDWCFSWIRRGSAVCVSSVGCVQNPTARKEFLRGYERMLEEIEPYQIILYGHSFTEFEQMTPDFVRVKDLFERRKEEYFKPKTLWDEMSIPQANPGRIEVA